ncbi:unnamed protein product [Closterium sp. NIES-64]|nr:unnamed protein product [Closterium sp. NIES-64]
MLPNDVVHTGHKLVEFSQEAEGSGEGSGAATKSASTPLLLGADGIHSEAQKHLLSGSAEGKGVSPRDNGRTIWRAIIDSSLCPHPKSSTGFLTLNDSAIRRSAARGSSGGEEARGKILRAFEGWDVVEQVVKATPPDLILERARARPPAPAVLGPREHRSSRRYAWGDDVAHAVTPGQGANMVFEDAAQLVECLRVHSHARWFSGGLSGTLSACHECKRWHLVTFVSPLLAISPLLLSILLPPLLLSHPSYSNPCVNPKWHLRSLRMPRVQAVASRYAAASKTIYGAKKEKKAAVNGGGAGSDRSEEDEVPKIEEVQAAMAAVAARRGVILMWICMVMTSCLGGGGSSCCECSAPVTCPC